MDNVMMRVVELLLLELVMPEVVELGKSMDVALFILTLMKAFPSKPVSTLPLGKGNGFLKQFLL